MVFIAVVVMTIPRVDSSCFIDTGNAPKMTYNYTMSSVLVSIALQKVVIGKEIIGIHIIQINHHIVESTIYFIYYFHCMF